MLKRRAALYSWLLCTEPYSAADFTGISWFFLLNLKNCDLHIACLNRGDRDNVVGIVICYGLGRLRIKSVGGKFFCICVLALGPIQPPVQLVLGLFPRSKATR